MGTRFLPATRTVPKPMLPVLDTPMLHLTLAEAAAAGIEQFALVISPGQETIIDYFNVRPDLDAALERLDDPALLERMRRLPGPADVTVIVQDRQLGLGHAVAMTRGFVGGEPFAVLLPDDVFWGEQPAIAALMDVFDRFGSGVLSVKELEEDRIPYMGIIDPAPVSANVFRVLGMVEKPRLEDAPSNLGGNGRYVLTADVFDALDGLPPGANGEIQLTDAIASMLAARPIYACVVAGVHVDAGTPVGLLTASVHEALRRPRASRAARALLERALAPPPAPPTGPA